MVPGLAAKAVIGKQDSVDPWPDQGKRPQTTVDGICHALEDTREPVENNLGLRYSKQVTLYLGLYMAALRPHGR